MKISYRISILLLALFSFSGLWSQDFSNKGKEFWLAYSYHVGMVNGGGSPVMTLYITSDEATAYQVSIYGGPGLQSGNIAAGQVVTVTIPSSYFIDGEGLFSNKAIRVTGDKPMVVYSYITRAAASGATLCLPTPVLGMEYYSANFTQASNEPNSNSYFTIVAVDDNTTVQITPAANTKNGWLAGNTYSVNLGKGQIYQVLGTTTNNTGVDLTGSRIRSVAGTAGGCKRIAVFSGSGKIRIPASNCSQNSSDNLYQQLYPTVSWGKKYLTVPSFNNTYNYYRILRVDPTTNVYLNGVLIPSASFINNYYTFFNNTPNQITSDKPISLAQYFTTQGCDGNSSNIPYDPDMIMLNPVEQNIDKVTLVSSNLAASQAPPAPAHQHHIHVIMRNGGTGKSSFKLDGTPIPLNSWITHPADPNYSYLYLNNVTQGYHRITSDSGFNAIAYGYAQYETYGYSAGANVKDLYQFVSIKNQYATVDYPATCDNSPFYFSMTFPYQPADIKWQFNGLFTDVTISSPVYDSTWTINGKQLYRYKLPTPYTIATPGTYPIRVIAQNLTTDGCSGEQEINYDLQVYARPQADFNYTTGGCTYDTVFFSDNSNTNGRPAYIWAWNLGDGNFASVPSPQHLYAAGSYNVKFAVVTDIGCLSDTVTKTINIYPAPQADFVLSSPLCETRDISFSDVSSVTTGAIIKWNWNLGDGNTFINSNSNPFVHSYAAAGNYSAILITETEKGCKDTVTKTVAINALPVAAFSMPDNCLADPWSQFTNESTIADGTQSLLSYNWNFGDPNATPSNPNISVQKDPQHKYTAVGNYNVSLIASSNNGCSDTVTQVFTINGALPQSIFSLPDGNAICSNQSVRIQGNSIVDFGSVVKLEIFWDYGNDPTFRDTIIYPVTGAIYNHTYPEFFTPSTKDVIIRVVAYSGENCLNSSEQTISLKASPEISFPAIPSVCANDPVVQLNQASVLNGLAGTGVYSGNGITATGSFDPAMAGNGIHTIRYTFNANNGCSNYKEQQVEVFTVPVVTAGPDKFVLEGGNTILEGSATGNNLSYSWSPVTRLNDASIPQPVCTPIEDISYTLTVVSADGCSATDHVLVKVLKMPSIPNVFTPNGDGINDRWEIKYLDSYPGATVEIFNRYGQLVFTSNGYFKPWDGSFNGKQVPAGTYYYIINPKNGRQRLSGFVDVVR